MGMEKGLFTHREKPLYLLRICRLPQVLFTKYRYLLWGGGGEGYCTCSPSGYFIQMNCCLPKQLFTQ